MEEEEEKRAEEMDDSSTSTSVQENSVIHDKSPSAKQKVAFADPIERSVEGSIDPDVALERIANEKRLALIGAWEESEKIKTENKAHKKFSAVEAWEMSKKAVVEARLKKIEEKMEKKKAKYAEKMKNKIADVHKEADEKRATVTAKRGENLINIEEMAVNLRSKRYMPPSTLKFLGCFGKQR